MKLAASTIQNSSTPRLPITRTKPVAKAECGCNFLSSRASIFSEAASSFNGTFTVCAEKKFCAEKKKKNEAEQFHRRLHDAVVEERGKSGERNRAINHFHRGRAEADEHRPQKTAPRAFVEDRQVDRPDGNRGENQRGDKTRRARREKLAASRAWSVRAVRLVVFLFDFTPPRAREAWAHETVNQIRGEKQQAGRNKEFFPAKSKCSRRTARR